MKKYTIGIRIGRLRLVVGLAVVGRAARRRPPLRIVGKAERRRMAARPMEQVPA